MTRREPLQALAEVKIRSQYNWRNIFTQSPEKVKTTLLAVLGVAAGLRGWDPDLLETVGVGIAVERLLDLFYVAPAQRTLVEAKVLEGIDLGRKLSPTP